MQAPESAKWKSKLLSSSLPLEFELAKLLIRRGFTVSADFTYERAEGDLVKDFSVDVHASWMPPTVKRAGASCYLTLLIECKHRHPGTAWLFLPDPNREPLSFTTRGTALRAIDGLSKWFLRARSTRVEQRLWRCYKGTEVDMNSGNVDDSQLRHGTSQLQHAIPSLLSGSLLTATVSASADNMPFFFAPILVTNAPLFLAHDTFSTRRVKRAGDLTELADQVPYLSLFVDPPPGFERHARRSFGDTRRLRESTNLREADEHKKSQGIREEDLPSAVAVLLSLGVVDAALQNPFSQIIVCQAGSLNEFVGIVKSEVIRLNRSVTLRKPRAG